MSYLPWLGPCSKPNAPRSRSTSRRSVNPAGELYQHFTSTSLENILSEAAQEHIISTIYQNILSL